jgi:DNA-binding NarL/FixJ family response regulator
MKILLIENETLVRVGLRTILSEQQEMQIVGEAATSAEGLEFFQRMNPDVTLMSLRFPDSCAVNEIEKFLRISPKAKIIVVASHAGDAEITRSLQEGAKGYICKDISEDELVKAVRTVAAGKKYIPTEVAAILSENVGQEPLTPSEHKVLEEIVSGKANKEIAYDLNISENTVKTHVKNIFDKLGVSDRTSATTTAIKRGFVRFDA